MFLHCTSFQSTSGGMFGLVYTIGLIYNAMCKYKSTLTVPSMTSCSFVYHGIGSAHLTLFLRCPWHGHGIALATKIGQLTNQ